MRPKELVELAFERQLFSDNIAGQTPAQTMKAKLSVHVRRLGDDSYFVRTEPGKFYLRHLLNGETVYPAPPLVPPRTHERVLTFSTNELDPLMTFQGVTRRWQPLLKKITKTLRPHYQPRLTVEDDKNYTQILTYILVTKKGRVLAYRRGTYNRAAEFLRGSFCVGIWWAHKIDSDPTLFSESPLGLADSAIRELSEELRLPDADVQRLKEGQALEIIGALNDDSSPVGRRHLAFVMRYEVSDDPGVAEAGAGREIDHATSVARRHDFTSTLISIRVLVSVVFARICRQIKQSPACFLIRQRARMRPPHLLCVVGEVGSGKSEATRVLTSEFGYHEINSGRVLAELIGIPPNSDTPREEFQRRAKQFIGKTNGPRRLARRLRLRLKKSSQIGS